MSLLTYLVKKKAIKKHLIPVNLEISMQIEFLQEQSNACVIPSRSARPTPIKLNYSKNYCFREEVGYSDFI